MKMNLKILVLAAASLLCSQAFSQAAPVLTFTPSTTTGAGSVTTTLTWATTPVAQSCTASGHTSWTGTKPVQSPAGGVTLPALTSSGSYSLTMSCVWPGDVKATVRWTTPTANTDGTPLAKCATDTTPGPCLAYFQVYRRLGQADLNGAEMTPVRNPSATSLVFDNLPVGTHYFGVEAVNGDAVASPMSNIASKTITASQNVTRSVTITVNPKPGATTVTVE